MKTFKVPQLAPTVGEIVVEVRADPTRDYPAGNLIYTFDAQHDDALQVLVAAIDLPDRSGRKTTTESFDDDFAIVRRDDTGQVCSVQLLRYAPGPNAVPELMESIAERDDAFLLDAVATAMMYWHPLAKACESVNQAAQKHLHWMMAKQVATNLWPETLAAK